MIKKLGIACSTLILLFACSTAPEPFTGGQLHGMVYDLDNQPCKAITIQLGADTSVQTDINGRFVFPYVEIGEHSILATAENYESEEFSIIFSAESEIVYIKMTHADQLLEMAKASFKEYKLHETSLYVERYKAIKPQEPRGRFLEASLAYRQKDFTKAESLLLGLLTEGYNEPAIYLFLADIYEEKTEQPELAIQQLQRYLELQYSADIEARIKKIEENL